MGLAQKPGTAPPSPGAPKPPQQPAASALGGLFTKKTVTPKPQASAGSKELAENVTNAIRRLRMVENRFDNIRKKIQFIENNMLDMQKKFSADIKATNMGVLEMKRGLLEMQSRLALVVKEVQLRANKDDVDVMKKYLSFWEPIKFVSRDQVEEMIEEALKEKNL